MHIRNINRRGFTPLETMMTKRKSSHHSVRVKKKFLTGFTLLEVVVYVALLGVLSVFVVNSFMQVVNLYARARAEREALANARGMLEIIVKNVAQAQEVYTPTSRFNIDAGQLSLVTNATSTLGHTTSYIDIWTDGGAAMIRSEGAGNVTLSAGSVRVTKLYFERIVQAIGREAIRVTIRVDAAGAKFPASVTLISTAAIRGNY